MSILLPPYSKIHIIVLGSIALIASFVLLVFFLPNQDKLDTLIIENNPSQFHQAHDTTLSKLKDGQLVSVWQEDRILIFDIRPALEFEVNHIVGSRNAPVEYMAESSFDTDTTIVIYSPDSQDLDQAATILEEKGVSKIIKLQGSVEELIAQGYTLAASESIMP